MPRSRSCVIYSCNNKGVHGFPLEEKLRSQWIKAARLDEMIKPGQPLKKYSSMCSKHFRRSDFMITKSSCSVSGKDRTRLRRKSVPSIFPWTDTSSLESEEVSEPNNLKQTDDLKFNPKSIVNTYSKRIKQFVKIPVIKMEPVSIITGDPLQLENKEDVLENMMKTPKVEIKIEVNNEEDYFMASQHYLERGRIKMEIEISDTEILPVTTEKCRVKLEKFADQRDQ